MKFQILNYNYPKNNSWNNFIENSNNGTLFHRLDFLAYHSDRFHSNEHHLAIYKGENLYAVMPMAIFEEKDRKIAKSPYGGSYGGLVFSKLQNHSDSHEIIKGLLDYLIQNNIDELVLTLPLSICYKRYGETFRLVLIEHGFECINRDISSVVCLNSDFDISKEMTSRSRNMARKARKAGVETIKHGCLEDFWQVMNQTFAKHDTKPTHTLEEFRYLHQCFPDRVYVDVAYLEKQPVAGIGYFEINQRVISSFYLCQNPKHQKTQALSLLIYESLLDLQQQGYEWFDFGTSSVNMKGHQNIFKFKESFGSFGVFRETYQWTNPH